MDGLEECFGNVIQRHLEHLHEVRIVMNSRSDRIVRCLECFPYRFPANRRFDFGFVDCRIGTQDICECIIVRLKNSEMLGPLDLGRCLAPSFSYSFVAQWCN